jgi:RNA polymerase sigma-70 factor (ECF subfamily)
MTELSNKWQSGDIDSFEALFQRYERLVLHNAFLITGNRAEAEDIVQEVFMAVWQARRTFDPEKGALTTWLHRITVNACLQKRRKQKVPTVSLEQAAWESISQDQEDALFEKQEHVILSQALAGLDKKHRAVLVLRYFDELAYDEIARALDIPLGTVKSRLYQALNLLRKRLAEQPEGQRNESV